MKNSPLTFPRSFEEARRLRMLGFDHDSIKAHFLANPPAVGDRLILASFQHHQLRYRLVAVVKADHGKQKRIIIDKGCCWGGSSYYRTGKSTFAPTGQTVLLPYVREVAALMGDKEEIVLTEVELKGLTLV